MNETVRITAHAKVNAFLRILSAEKTGYHGIETFFSLIELADIINVVRIPSGIELDVTGADTGPVEDNLVYRAAQLMIEATGGTFGVRIRLDKHIPVEAGLGGGSSDAAATLHAVNQLANRAVPRHELLQFGARLGADVPFFVSGAPTALAWGHGDRLFQIPAPAPAPALIVVPNKGMSTSDAYRAIDQGGVPARGAVLFDEDVFRTWGNIARLGGNDFEAILFSRQPSIRETFERLAGTGPLLVRLTGSGSALFAIYRSPQALEDGRMTVGTKHQLISTMTRNVPAPGPTSSEDAES